MSILVIIENQYLETEKTFSKLEFIAIGEGNAASENDWRHKRELNTHAYFLFLFTRLEDVIKKKSNELIDAKIAGAATWQDKAIWETIDKSRIAFMDRVCLLTQKGHTDFRDIQKYYSTRNTIAHGGTISDFIRSINMPLVFEDFKKYYIRFGV